MKRILLRTNSHEPITDFQWRYRLVARTGGSQPSNRGSTPRSATNLCKCLPRNNLAGTVINSICVQGPCHLLCFRSWILHLQHSLHLQIRIVSRFNCHNSHTLNYFLALLNNVRCLLILSMPLRCSEDIASLWGSPIHLYFEWLDSQIRFLLWGDFCSGVSYRREHHLWRKILVA